MSVELACTTADPYRMVECLEPTHKAPACTAAGRQVLVNRRVLRPARVNTRAGHMATMHTAPTGNLVLPVLPWHSAAVRSSAEGNTASRTRPDWPSVAPELACIAAHCRAA